METSVAVGDGWTGVALPTALHAEYDGTDRGLLYRMQREVKEVPLRSLPSSFPRFFLSRSSSKFASAASLPPYPPPPSLSEDGSLTISFPCCVASFPP